MAAGRLHVEPDVELCHVEQAEHGDVAEDDLAVGRGRPGGGERAAMVLTRRHRARRRRLGKLDSLQARRRRLQRAIEERHFDIRVDGHNIDEVQAAAVELRAGIGGAVGDALHLLELLAVVAAQEQGVDELPRVLPRIFGRLGAVALGQHADVVGDLSRQQLAVLIAALVRLAFDVQHDPAGLRIAIRRPMTYHRCRIGHKISWRRRRRSPGDEVFSHCDRSNTNPSQRKQCSRAEAR